MDSAIIAAIIAGAVTLAGGILTRLGKKDEVAATRTSSLVASMEARLQGYEKRLDHAEQRIDSLKAELWRFQTHTNALRHALSSALVWIADAVEWINSDHTTTPPAPPDSAAWTALVKGASTDLDN
ncbi:hypothetical protein HW450_06830 [Corynebacterium hindlerae]|uniref:Uncharacterized protein n=1 Tax=Corynebacterium hindlerae TaxID=699041 RepID=A0A7G5FBW3_9CORY|nr:hypothetical protein [Corynebacterium hindlerae]QMV84104.1 hypothetical protein HW450_06830 [Corynebacterium hindlerae]